MSIPKKEFSFNDLAPIKQTLVAAVLSPRIEGTLYHHLAEPLYELLTTQVGSLPTEVIAKMLHEEELMEYLKSQKVNITPTDQHVRYLFWMEFELAREQRREMVLTNIHSLVCDADTFKNIFLTDPLRVLLLLCKPIPYQQLLQSLLLLGMSKMRKILELPVEDPLTGKVNTNLIGTQMRIVTMIDNRLHGAPTQKLVALHQTAASVNPTHGKRTPQELIASGDIEAIKARLQEIKEKKALLEGRDRGSTDDPNIPEVTEEEIQKEEEEARLLKLGRRYVEDKKIRRMAGRKKAQVIDVTEGSGES